MLAKMWGKEALTNCWWQCKFIQALWKSSWRFLNKLKIELSSNPGIPFLGIHTKESA
jgi:hypothetical protein